jgi:hypothetical protein
MNENEERPWERLGVVRRDAIPHRGRLLSVLGNACLVLGLVSLCSIAPSVFALGMSVAVWVLAKHDLKQMEIGLMDQDEGETGQALTRAMLGTTLGSLCLPVLVYLIFQRLVQ